MIRRNEFRDSYRFAMTGMSAAQNLLEGGGAGPKTGRLRRFSPHAILQRSQNGLSLTCLNLLAVWE